MYYIILCFMLVFLVAFCVYYVFILLRDNNLQDSQPYRQPAVGSQQMDDAKKAKLIVHRQAGSRVGFFR